MKKRMKKVLSKRTVACFVAAVLLVACFPLFTFAEESDIKGHWAESFMTRMVDQGILAGMGNGKLEPDRELPVSNYITMINKVFGYTETTQISYSDVKADEWHFLQFQLAANAGYFTGYSDRTARPDQTMTRWEAFYTLWKSMGIPEGSLSSLSKFSDADRIPAEARGALAAFVERGIVAGYTDGTIRPENELTRAEGAAIISQFATEIMAGTVNRKDVNGNVIINEAGTVLTNVTISGDLYIAEGVGDGDVTLDNVSVGGTIYVRGGGVNSIHLVNTRTARLTVNKESAVRLVFEKNSYVGELQAETDVRIYNNTTKPAGGRETGIGTLVVESASRKKIDLTLEGVFNKVTVKSDVAMKLAKGTAVKSMETASNAKTDIKADKGVSIESLTAGAEITVNDNTVTAGNKQVTTAADGNKIVVEDVDTGETEVEVDVATVESPSAVEEKKEEAGAAATPTTASTQAPVAVATESPTYGPAGTTAPVSTQTPAPTQSPSPSPTPTASPTPTPTPTAKPSLTEAELRAQKAAQIQDAIDGNKYSTTIGYDAENNSITVSGNSKMDSAKAISDVLVKDTDVSQIIYNGKTYDKNNSNDLLDLSDAMYELAKSGGDNAQIGVTYKKDGVTTTVDYDITIK